MTTTINPGVVVEASGLVRVCCYCVPRARLAELHQAHRCTDGICQSCHDAMFADVDATHGPVLMVERTVEDVARERRAA
jgi:hypothetical protein